jgi:DNA-3-methyladenine glycosylase
MPPPPLPVSFYDRAVQEVARGLLGARLIRRREDGRIAGYIIETEAYDGEQDLACHARAGRTARTQVMYGPPGRAYVYFIYGMHWMLNCVTGPQGYPAAVLIRAILPSEGLDLIAGRRAGVHPRDWTNGPARLCQALDIDGRFNGASLAGPDSSLWIEPGRPPPETRIAAGPRVGIGGVAEPWRSKPWRYQVDPQNWEPSLS